jgi:N-hydroxyarylamine O-acetyltransferase
VVDVGFGARGGRVPFRLDQRTPQSDGVGEYRVDADGDLYSLTFRSGATWPHLYDFTLIPRRPEDFWERCRAQQADPYWRDRLICTRATADGTLSLNGRRFAWTRGAERRERDLASTAELIEILRDYFGIVLPAEESIDVYLTGDHRERSRAR